MYRVTLLYSFKIHNLYLYQAQMQSIKKKFTSKRRGNVDKQPGRHYFFTIPYGFYFLIGAFAGYGKDHSKVCLFGSGACGLVVLFFGIAHFIDYRRGNVEIERIYIIFPLLVSMIVAILMSCFYGLGSAFMPSGFVAICCWIAAIYYIYAIVVDIGARVLDHPYSTRGYSNWIQSLGHKSTGGLSQSAEENKNFI